MKLRFRELLIIILLLVSLSPIIGLSGLNWWKFSAEDKIDKQLFLENYINYVNNILLINQDRIASTLDNFALTINTFNYDISKKNYHKINDLLDNLRKSSDLDLMFIIELNNSGHLKIFKKDLSNNPGIKFIFNEALKGKTTTITTIIEDKIIAQKAKKLINKTNINILSSDKHLKEKVLDSSRGLFLFTATPVTNSSKKITAVLFGGKIITKELFTIKTNPKPFDKVNITIQPAGIALPKSTDYKILEIINPNNQHVANLVAWFDKDVTLDATNISRINTIYTIALTVFIVFIISVIGANYLTYPFERLDKAIKAIFHNNFSPLTDFPGPIEIHNFIQAFNSMALQIQTKHQMREMFISTLAHDMRVPLLAEQTALKLISQDSKNLSEMQSTLMNNLTSNNTELLQLVNTLLDTYKLEAGKYKLNLHQNNIIETLNECINELNPVIIENNLSINLESAEIIPPLMFDKPEIKRVIRNLISNAIKFNNPEGTIKIKTTLNNNFVTVAISDTGRGMNDEDVKNLFQQYYSSSKKQKKIGTGLGLYLSYQLIKAHNGDMCAESKLNEGSTFYFTLPLT